MQRHHQLMHALQTGYTTIEVVFPRDQNHYGPNTSRRYCYKVWERDNVQVGDSVVVDTPSNGLTLVKVVAVHKTPQIESHVSFSYKWIVQKVDRSGYEAQQAKEGQFLDTMDEIERRDRRAKVLQAAIADLPEGTQSRILFENAVKLLES